MSKQITVRLPDELVTFMDSEVTAQHCSSRAALVAAALEHYRDRVIGEAIVAGYQAIPDGDDEDLDEFLAAAEQSVWSDEQ
ncbi:ribbon-helix-helix domain-containing protein [Nocardia sp. NPDC127579]|uniref:ribbon-helix-helix domain-containing protein n=1 Tax=Nocardia sp. NPDC127579 TaxID=3345402 RepID=UPI00362C724A